jgi:hypothetical protein
MIGHGKYLLSSAMDVSEMYISGGLEKVVETDLKVNP